MNCSLDLHPRGYQLTMTQRLAMPFVSTYALRHLALANQETSTCKRLVHRVIAVIELIPIVGLLASLIERIIILVRDCLFPKRKNDNIALFPRFDETFPKDIQKLIFSNLTERELNEIQQANSEIGRSNEVALKAQRDNILEENPEYRDAAKLWDQTKIPLKEQIARLDELRQYIFGTEKWTRFISSFKFRRKGMIVTRDQSVGNIKLKLHKKKGILKTISYKDKIVGEIAQLPANVYEILNSYDSIPKKQVKHTHLIALVPKSFRINNKIFDLTANFLKNLMIEDSEYWEHAVDENYRCDIFSSGDNVAMTSESKDAIQSVENTHWLFLKPWIQGTKQREQQVQKMNELSIHHKTQYTYPKAIDIMVSRLLMFLNRDEFSDTVDRESGGGRNLHYLTAMVKGLYDFRAICQDKLRSGESIEFYSYHITNSVSIEIGINLHDMADRSDIAAVRQL